jgi:hypothetical protein
MANFNNVHLNLHRLLTLPCVLWWVYLLTQVYKSYKNVKGEFIIKTSTFNRYIRQKIKKNRLYSSLRYVFMVCVSIKFLLRLIYFFSFLYLSCVKTVAYKGDHLGISLVIYDVEGWTHWQNCTWINIGWLFTKIADDICVDHFYPYSHF